MTSLEPKGSRGSTACQETDGHREGVEDGPSGDPRDMENCLDWLKPSLQLMQREHPPEGRMKPVSCPASVSQRCRCNLRDMKRHPAGVEKEMNGIPKSR